MFSIQPNGALLLSETVYNNTAAQEKIKTELESKLDTYDPVDALAYHLRDIYPQVKALLNEPYQPDVDAVGICEKLDHVSDLASTVAELMVSCFTKQHAYLQLIERDDWIIMGIKGFFGPILKNKHKLTQTGYDSIVSNVSKLPMYDHALPSCLAVYMETSDLKLSDNPISLDIFREYKTYHHDDRYLDDYFRDTVDMLDCLIVDIERRIRLEVPEQIAVDISDIINRCSSVYDGNRPIYNADNSPGHGIIPYISMHLRLVKQSIYDIQCKLLEKEYDISDNEKLYIEIKKIYSTIFDMFAVSAIIMFNKAYESRRFIVYRQMFTEFVNNALNIIKPGN